MYLPNIKINTILPEGRRTTPRMYVRSRLDIGELRRDKSYENRTIILNNQLKLKGTVSLHVKNSVSP